ncbi:carbohydrate ABC transporter permease [Stackebrandtia nassauensis]|uniref:Binding-protein-dependent transport systems inner membrane component n=1 Tax=Stackebrandtia nassauensis (strain DSM 44728 / CIP 108903 / NRRL B-16338 / NBRC 102104 / LLR-40K-21) TaxID=446470 RepID=D3Q8F7_STANL|nr:sugar ABC transporter permease [Stackebrandtia nassauensis]ADD42531.1 binding-protein-dependent transport systems inner membrane component [Stackebrandtia nassauensis DSM 44728]
MTDSSQAIRRPAKSRKVTKIKQGRFILVFLALPILLYAYLVVFPLAEMFRISFTDWSGLSPDFSYVGFDNYIDMWSDPKGWVVPGFWHTGIMLLVLPVAVIVLALFFAFMLNVGGRGTGKITGVKGASFYKIVYFFPQVLSLIVIAILWRQIYAGPSDGGVLANVLSSLGLPSPESGFINEESMVLPAVIVAMIWASVGFYFVYFSAAMSGIPEELYEAARIDGASRTTTFFKITLPLLWDSVQTAWVYLGIIALDGFVLVYAMTPGAGGGGPNHASEVIGGVIFKFALGDGRNAGMGSALGVIVFLFMSVVTVVFLRATRRDRVEY